MTLNISRATSHEGHERSLLTRQVSTKVSLRELAISESKPRYYVLNAAGQPEPARITCMSDVVHFGRWNGCGVYADLVTFVAEYLAACLSNPAATVMAAL